jgi:hypothetical protein
MKKILAMLMLVALSFTTISTVYAFQQHLKKDGTPDKRFKENKKTAVHLKKNGTPDMRHKENKIKVETKKTEVTKKKVTKMKK